MLYRTILSLCVMSCAVTSGQNEHGQANATLKHGDTVSGKVVVVNDRSFFFFGSAPIKYRVVLSRSSTMGSIRVAGHLATESGSQLPDSAASVTFTCRGGTIEDVRTGRRTPVPFFEWVAREVVAIDSSGSFIVAIDSCVHDDAGILLWSSGTGVGRFLDCGEVWGKGLCVPNRCD